MNICGGRVTGLKSKVSEKTGKTYRTVEISDGGYRQELKVSPELHEELRASGIDLEALVEQFDTTGVATEVRAQFRIFNLSGRDRWPDGSPKPAELSAVAIEVAPHEVTAAAGRK